MTLKSILKKVKRYLFPESEYSWHKTESLPLWVLKARYEFEGGERKRTIVRTTKYFTGKNYIYKIKYGDCKEQGGYTEIQWYVKKR